MSKNTKKRVHISLTRRISEVAEKLAELEGRTFSELVEELLRDHLKARGMLPQATAEEVLNNLKTRE